MDDFVEQFREAIHNAGLIPPKIIEPNGKMHRFASNGKPGDDAGWYVLYGDGIPAGAFGDWRSGVSETWRADIGRRLTPQEEATHRARTESMRRQRGAEDAKRKTEAREKAAVIWQAAQPAPDDHPYLVKKGVKAHGLRVHDGELIIPMRDGTTLHSMQFIRADGDKRFLFGGRVSGCYFPIGKPDGALCIAEGFATGASIHEATGRAVVVAFNAGNLLPVAQALRAKFPDLRLIVCADDDADTSGNPGLTKGRETAQAVGALLAVPDFGASRPDGATDFNDMALQCGAEAVACAIAAATAPATGEPQADSENAPAGDHARSVQLVRGSDIRPEPISWLWDGWLAAGKMHVLGGAPGTGKTSIALALAATVTAGGCWPDGAKSHLGSVVMWSGEDDPADTLIPRLVQSGADLSRIYFITDVREGNERRSFDPARDMEPLRRKLVEIGGVQLLIIDPIVSAIAGDSHKNAEVRRGLQPLADLAASMRCALLGITHFSKGTGGRNPVERLTGSLAFGAVARVVLVAAKHQKKDDDGRPVHVFVRAKSNIGPDSGGFEYTLHQAELETHPGIFASSVLWGEAVEGAARELLAAADATSDDSEGGALDDAKLFLADLLANGPLPTMAIKADAKGAGYSWATMRRAQKALGIEVAKVGMKGGWHWRRPRHEVENAKMLKNAEDAQQNQVSTFGNLEHLRCESGAVEVEI